MACGIGSDSCDAVRSQRTTRGFRKPRNVAWLASHRATISPSQQIKKRQRNRRVIRQAGRQLQQEAAELFAELIDLGQERVQQWLTRFQFRLMTDGLGHLYRKPETPWHCICPFTVSCRLMGSIKGGVDFNRVEYLCVALKMSAICKETACVHRRYRPAGGPYVKRGDRVQGRGNNPLR